ncbi:pirin family protein [Variovorax terrae]|uniref:Pirin family protein n=1 Tax=Variovorax terrae TaxID=2923278 RepID=A0A9X2AMK3_9BURK|nr:pirin family protein [Variovorax terrae]MCJ0763444.1 pirin family protein [Variovorax terrae]
MKQLSFIQRGNGSHWVGDGFPVRSVFSYNDIHEEMSPFLLLDYAGPVNFPPTQARRGVGQHPHRGFETVTIVYDGEVEHRDSTGGGGTIGPGDVQWMTAAGGIVHEEYHGPNFARTGGPFEMIQLWVNLPAKDKMSKPGYQGITDAQIPRVELPGGAGQVRVIAGRYQGAAGPAHTFSPMNVWDLRVKAGQHVSFELPEGHTTALFVLKGGVRLPGGEAVREAELAVMERAGTQLAFDALEEDTTLLLLGGEPTNEPIVGYGPFVMNSEAEIRQAFADFQSGKMGRIAAAA